MFKRQTTGSVVCTSCGQLVGVNDETCYNCGRRNPGLWGWAPAFRALGNDMGFVTFVTGLCVIVYVLTLIMSRGDIGMNGMFGLLSPNTVSLVIFGASGAFPVFTLDRWWTVLTAAWLHGGLLHIFFNMYWIRQLAPAVGEMYGAGRMIIIYTVSAITGFGLTSLIGFAMPELPSLLAGAPLTVGASAPIFGLLGALVYYGRRSGSSAVGSQARSLALIMALFGFIFPAIDNWAHGGGFLGGYLVGQWLDPLKPERIDHLVVAVVCLAASLLSIILSVVTGLALL